MPILFGILVSCAIYPHELKLETFEDFFFCAFKKLVLQWEMEFSGLIMAGHVRFPHQLAMA